MKQLVVNKFSQVAVVVEGFCVHNVYGSLADAIEAVSKSYYNTIWSEKDLSVCFYGWVVEPNGYPHTADKLLACKESQFWGGKKPIINIIEKR